ncbi:MAG: 4-hydroxy-tetrahydrodipicolinate reductase, partial [Atopobiaceae bacterium]|nr:4-hydroxy-tetrahydrodipicolinate reductase [Atopobiaceae bacterium]
AYMAEEENEMANGPVRVLVVGAGNMGKALVGLIETDDSLELVSCVGRANVDVLAEPEGGSAASEPTDVLIDFSHPGMLPAVADYVRRTGCAYVEGSTGFSEADIATIRGLADAAPVLLGENFAIGIQVLKRLLIEAVSALSDWDVEVVEGHHAGKVDSPSATAKMLVAAMFGEDALASDGRIAYGREGMVGPRPKGQIGMHSLRGGVSAGYHTVHFLGPDEELELTHRAHSNSIFARGAIACAKKLVGCEPGWYDFDEFMRAL